MRFPSHVSADSSEFQRRMQKAAISLSVFIVWSADPFRNLLWDVMDDRRIPWPVNPARGSYRWFAQAWQKRDA